MNKNYTQPYPTINQLSHTFADHFAKFVLSQKYSFNVTDTVATQEHVSLIRESFEVKFNPRVISDLTVGTILATKDGREVGNAIILKVLKEDCIILTDIGKIWSFSLKDFSYYFHLPDFYFNIIKPLPDHFVPTAKLI